MTHRLPVWKPGTLQRTLYDSVSLQREKSPSAATQWPVTSSTVIGNRASHRARAHGSRRLGGGGREWRANGANQCCQGGWETTPATGSASEGAWRRSGEGP